MFLTSEILNQYDACQEGKDWFARFFPNGAELIDVIHARHAPAAFLHWGKLHLTTTPEEQRAYNEVLHIENSTGVFECSNIKNCDMITSSEYVTDSKYIYHCRNVENSEDITDSSKIKDSKHIIISSTVFSSDGCVHANNIKNSHNILSGDFIIDSHDIYNSSLITNSSFVFNSKNISDSGFIAQSHDLAHCLFCYDYEKPKEYSIFNHPIGDIQWNFIYEEYQEQLKNLHLRLFDSWECEDSTHDVIIHRSYIEMFEGFSTNLPQFVHWVQHLPFYDPMIAYKITFIPNFMQ